MPIITALQDVPISGMENGEINGKFLYINDIQL